MGAARPRILAVDGNSLGHRAFHSGRADAEAAEVTRPFVTGGVVTMLASAWVEGPYDGVVVAFDHPDNDRKLEHPEYKANRAETHPDLPRHLTVLRTHLADCGFLVAEHPGAEADDLLAAVADACVERGWPCDLLSSDRDLLALVGPTTRLLRPRATFADLRIEDEAAVRTAYGIEPHQYTDLAALRGDPSDGLDGVRGIGPKTAARLLRHYGSVAGIYEAICHLPPRIEAALREGRSRVERNLLLMAPIPRLEVDVAAAVAAGVDPDRVTAALDALALYGPARRFARAVTAPPPPPMPPPPDEEPVDLVVMVDAPVGVGAGAPGPRVAVRAVPAEGEQVALF